MEIMLAILTGVLYTAGVYMLLRRSILKFIIGIIFMSNATNILVFLAAGVVRGNPAFVNETIADTKPVADPLPQAHVLTAIVIGYHCFYACIKIQILSAYRNRRFRST